VRWFVVAIFICFVKASFADSECSIGLEKKYSIELKSYREKSFVADFVYPKNCLKFQKIVITFGGSEGGVNTRLAKRLASNGFGVYALGYFNVKDSSLPKFLVQIPLEYFERAIHKIKEMHPNTKCCSLVGGSKGAEAILTLISNTDVGPNRVVLISGPDRVMEGLGKQNKPSKSSSWSFKGKDISYTSLDDLTLMELFKLAWGLFKKPISLREMYLRSINNQKTGENGLVSVKNIRSVVLFLSGEDDNLWPSSVMGSSLEKLFKSNVNASFQHISYKGVGHAVLGGHHALQSKNNQVFLGGNIEDSKEADKDAYTRIVNFLNVVDDL